MGGYELLGMLFVVWVDVWVDVWKAVWRWRCGVGINYGLVWSAWDWVDGWPEGT